MADRMTADEFEALAWSENSGWLQRAADVIRELEAERELYIVEQASRDRLVEKLRAHEEWLEQMPEEYGARFGLRFREWRSKRPKQEESK